MAQWKRPGSKAAFGGENRPQQCSSGKIIHFSQFTGIKTADSGSSKDEINWLQIGVQLASAFENRTCRPANSCRRASYRRIILPTRMPLIALKSLNVAFTKVEGVIKRHLFSASGSYRSPLSCLGSRTGPHRPYKWR